MPSIARATTAIAAILTREGIDYAQSKSIRLGQALFPTILSNREAVLRTCSTAPVMAVSEVKEGRPS